MARRVMATQEVEPEKPKGVFREIGSQQSVTIEVKQYSSLGSPAYYATHHLTPDEADALARELHDKAAEVRRGWAPPA